MVVNTTAETYDLQQRNQNPLLLNRQLLRPGMLQDSLVLDIKLRSRDAPDRPRMREWVPNSGSMPRSARCFSMTAVVSGRWYRPCAAASFRSMAFTIFSKPVSTSLQKRKTVVSWI